MISEKLFITGAGVSKDSGIPTFRGEDGFWTVGSKNYTPQEMATRSMYVRNPQQFLLWYFQRFACYRSTKPNSTHNWLANKRLITQNIDGLDGKAGNRNYIPIHGRLDKVSTFQDEMSATELFRAPWVEIETAYGGNDDQDFLANLLLDAFKISHLTKTPEKGKSLKPFVLLFDEHYTELFSISKAINWMKTCSSIAFIGTSFSVGITSLALEIAIEKGCLIEVVDPNPIELNISGVKYHRLTASQYIAQQEETRTSSS